MNRSLFHCRAMAVGLLTLMSVSANAQLRESRAGTRFDLYAPPNNVAGTRSVAVIVTALAGDSGAPTIVDLVDDGADGDSDDTRMGVPLQRGQSLVRYLKDGTVNDDNRGTWDGDLFHVRATLPVTCMVATDSDWQHDWAPADDGSLRGTRFVLFANAFSVSQRDVDAFAYEDGTHVELWDISASTLVGSGVASVKARGGIPLLSADLDEGQDLMEFYGLGRDLLAAGRTYELVATKPVSVLFGAIGSVTPQNQARDGSGFVPGRTGSPIDDDFYFAVPHNPGLTNEQEIRIMSADDNVVATLWGWNTSIAAWEPVRVFTMDRLEHRDVVGPSQTLFRLTAEGGRVMLYEANWLETGASGTSDESDAVPALYDDGGAGRWLVYLGPPGLQDNTTTAGQFTHLYLSADHEDRVATVIDADTGGEIVNRTVTVPAHSVVDVRIDTTTYQLLNRPGSGIRPYLLIESDGVMSVIMSNWNDNWMAFHTAVVPANPEVTVLAPSTVARGTTAVFDGTVSDRVGLGLSDLTVTLTSPPGTRIVAATLDNVPASSITTASSEGRAIFDPVDLAPGATIPIEAEVAFDDGVAGAIASISVAAAGIDETGGHGAAIGTGATTMIDGRVPFISAFRAVGGDGRVTLTASLLADAGVSSTVQLQRSTAASGPFMAVAGVPGQVDVGDGTAHLLTFVDLVANGSNLYYRLVATTIDNVGAAAGPVLGQPQDTTPPPVPTLQAVVGDGTVGLTVGGSVVSDLRGYFISRASSEAGPFVRLNPTAMAAGTLQSAAANFTTVYYRATSIDTAGNESAPSVIFAATPRSTGSRQSTMLVSFEDMIGAGANDWDYNDLVVEVDAWEAVDDAGRTTRIVIEVEALARGAGYIHELHQHLPLTGPWTARLQRFAPGALDDPLVVEDLSGSGPLDAVLFADTREALPPQAGSFTNTTPGEATPLAGQMARLEVTLSTPTMAANVAAAAPWDLHLHLPWLPAGQNEVHRAELGGALELSAGSPSGPLDEVPLPFVLVDIVADPAWPFEGERIWRPWPGFVEETLFRSAPTWRDTEKSDDQAFRKRRRR